MFYKGFVAGLFIDIVLATALIINRLDTIILLLRKTHP